MLLEEREADPLGFATEKQNEPLAESSQVFKNKIQVYGFPPTGDWTGWKLSLACDLSLGRSEQGDYSAIVGIAMSPEGHFFQIYEDIQRRTPDQITRDLIAALLMFPYNIAGVETSGNQAYFLGENLNSGFRKSVADYNKVNEKKILTPLVPIESKGDKIKRIVGRLQTPISTGLLKLRNDSIFLYKQLNEFPFGYKDGPDALDMAFDLLVNAPIVKSSSGQVKASGAKKRF
jgi:hypothetical protein